MNEAKDNALDINNISKDSYILPVSSGQERLWFLQALDESLGAAYNISAAFKIRQNINRIALQHAVNTIVLRHESLRTGICKIDGTIKQIVDPHLVVTVSYHDYVSLNDKHQHIVQKMQSEAKKPFILSSPGLVRFSLYRAEPDCFYLLIILHHSIADGISLQIMIDEIVTCYQQILTTGETSLPKLEYQFADLIAWQDEQRTAELEQSDINYWQKKLSGVNTSVQFIESKMRSGTSNFLGETLPLCLDVKVFAGIATLSKKLRVSPYCVLFSAFALLVHYHSGHTDFLIGVPTVNREHQDAWAAVGYFANTVIIRVNFNLINTVEDLLLQVHETMSEALSHQDLSVSKVVEGIQSQRSDNLGTVFQLMFSYQESQHIKTILKSFNAEKILIDNGLSKFDIFFLLLNDNNSLEGYIEYSTELFDKDTICQLIQHYVLICTTLSQRLPLSLYDADLLSKLTSADIQRHINQTKNHSSTGINDDFFGTESNRQNSLIEDELIIIWQEILETQHPISTNANFFNLGGNSLLLTKVVDKINKKLSVAIPIKVIFLNPTIEKIAEYINSMKSSSLSADKITDKMIHLFEKSELENMMKEIA